MAHKSVRTVNYKLVISADLKASGEVQPERLYRPHPNGDAAETNCATQHRPKPRSPVQRGKRGLLGEEKPKAHASDLPRLQLSVCPISPPLTSVTVKPTMLDDR